MTRNEDIVQGGFQFGLSTCPPDKIDDGEPKDLALRSIYQWPESKIFNCYGELYTVAPASPGMGSHPPNQPGVGWDQREEGVAMVSLFTISSQTENSKNHSVSTRV